LAKTVTGNGECGRNRKAVNIIGAICGNKRIGIESCGKPAGRWFFESWFSRLIKLLPAACTIILDNARFHRKEPIGQEKPVEMSP
jgi:hypothetical protein